MLLLVKNHSTSRRSTAAMVIPESCPACGSTRYKKNGSCTSWLRVIRLIQESGTMASHDTMMRRHCHDSAPRLLPAGRHRIPLVMYHAALYLAESKCSVPLAANGIRPHQVETHTHERAQ